MAFVRVCPLCGEILGEQEGRSGKFLRCSGFPECRYAEKDAVAEKKRETGSSTKKSRRQTYLSTNREKSPEHDDSFGLSRPEQSQNDSRRNVGRGRVDSGRNSKVSEDLEAQAYENETNERGARLFPVREAYSV